MFIWRPNALFERASRHESEWSRAVKSIAASGPAPKFQNLVANHGLAFRIRHPRTRSCRESSGRSRDGAAPLQSDQGDWGPVLCERSCRQGFRVRAGKRHGGKAPLPLPRAGGHCHRCDVLHSTAHMEVLASPAPHRVILGGLFPNRLINEEEKKKKEKPSHLERLSYECSDDVQTSRKQIVPRFACLGSDDLPAQFERANIPH